MEQLIEFTELQQVLQELAIDIRKNYREHLKANDRYTTNWALIKSVKTEVVVGERKFEITMTLNDYWKYVEQGVFGEENGSSPFKNPGWKAYPFILNWVKIKPVIPRPDSRGRIPKPKQLAYLITRSIVKNGTHGSHDLWAVKENVIPWYMDRIREALAHDTANYIRKLVVEK